MHDIYYERCDMQNTIGETICQYRQLCKLTQEEFASRIGVETD